jgi:hypothetical protein
MEPEMNSQEDKYTLLSDLQQIINCVTLWLLRNV